MSKRAQCSTNNISASGISWLHSMILPSRTLVNLTHNTYCCHGVRHQYVTVIAIHVFLHDGVSVIDCTAHALLLQATTKCRDGIKSFCGQHNAVMGIMTCAFCKTNAWHAVTSMHSGLFQTAHCIYSSNRDLRQPTTHALLVDGL